MQKRYDDIFTPRELLTLSSIIQVGEATYRELMETQYPMFRHPYMRDIKGRIRTKLVQIQCELESHDPKFPFEFVQHEFEYGHIIPELRNGKVILHIARSSSPEVLPYPSSYKISLSNNNHTLNRQMVMDFGQPISCVDEPYYGILTFGGREQTFSVIQFPEPGYESVAESIILPQTYPDEISENAEIFERKKAVLKNEFLAQPFEEVI